MARASYAFASTHWLAQGRNTERIAADRIAGSRGKPLVGL
jgi:hypothetical protein